MHLQGVGQKRELQGEGEESLSFWERAVSLPMPKQR